MPSWNSQQYLKFEAERTRPCRDLVARIPLENPNPAMNQMFIVEPFCGEKLTNLFATHPPTEERVAALMTLRPGRTVA